MKRATLLAVLMGLLMAITAGVAVAKVVQGTPGDDRLSGTERADTIKGSGGDDALFGKGGRDELKGGFGNDRVYGSDGKDQLGGAGGADLLSAGKGNDKLTGGFQQDRAYGSGGDDLFNVGGDAETDYVFCSGGYDTVEMDGNDVIASGEGQTSGSELLVGTEPVFNCEKVVVDGTVVVFTPQV